MKKHNWIPMIIGVIMMLLSIYLAVPDSRPYIIGGIGAILFFIGLYETN